MYISIVPTSVLFVLIWNPPIHSSHAAIAGYLALCLIAIRFFDTLFELPHAALAPEMTRNYDARTKLFTVRYLFEATGGIAVTALAYNVFMKQNPDGTGGILSVHGYARFSLFTGAIILVSLTACTVGLHRLMPTVSSLTGRRFHLRKAVREVVEALRSKPLMILLCAAIFVSVGSGISSALNIYWLIYLYGFSQAQMTLISLPIMLGMLVTTATPAIAARMGKRNAALVLIWIYAISTMVPLLARLTNLLPAQSEVLLAIVAIQSAFGAASMTMVLIIFASMISDLVEDAEVRTGRRSEGLLLAANNFVRKATQGLGTLGAGVLLTWVEFPAGGVRADISPSILDHLGWSYLITSFVLFVVTATVLGFYRLDRSAHEANLRELESREPGQG